MTTQVTPNGQNYMDQALSFEMVRNLCNGKGNAWSELGKFILIIGMDQFKVLFKAVVDKLVKSIGEMSFIDILKSPIEFVKWMLSFFKNAFTRQSQYCYPLSNDENEIELEGTVIHTDIDLQLSFWEFITSEEFKPHLSYSVDKTESIKQIDNNTFQYTECWKEVMIAIPNCETKMIFDTQLKFLIENKFNKKMIKEVNKTKENGFNDTIDYEKVVLKFFYNCKKEQCDNLKLHPTRHNESVLYPDITIFSNSNVITNILDQIPNLLLKYSEEKSAIFNTLKSENPENSIELFESAFYINDHKYIYTKNADSTLKRYYRNFQLMISCFGIFYHDFSTKNRSFKKDIKIKYPKLFDSKYVVFGFPYTCQIEDIIPKLETVLSYHKKLILMLSDKLIKDLFKDNTTYCLFINWLYTLNNLEPPYNDFNISNNGELTSHNKITLYSPIKNCDEKMREQLFNFIHLSSNNKKLTNNCEKVKTFEIKMEYKEEEVKTKNPLFEIAQKRLQEFKSLDKSETCDKLIGECVSMMPSEFIIEMKYTKEVVCNHINEIYKSLDRLYLSKKDNNKLTTMLHSFRDDKELFQSLGLSNKLCVLLYGEPGCGKSSTIEVIGSYLQKDIYNLNLRSVRSNEDLGALWDFVTNKTTNGGCIVMEDIDASTNVVLERNSHTKNEDFTTVQPLTPNETPLSLSYLLNILQGSLQRDNSVVVVTTNWIQKLDPAFTRSMRFDVKIDMKPADHHQIISIWKVYFPKREVPTELIKSIPEHKYTPAQFIDEFRQYIKTQDISDEEILSQFK